MKVTITDLQTSINLAKDFKGIVYGGCVLSKKIKYVWVGRIDKYTKAELKKGKKENPGLITMPIEKLDKLVGEKSDLKHRNKTAILFPSTNDIHFFMSLCFPAYTKIPDGKKGKMITVDLQDD